MRLDLRSGKWGSGGDLLQAGKKLPSLGPARSLATLSAADVMDATLEGTLESATASRVESRAGISVIRGGENCREWNGIHYRTGMSAKNVGARELSMNVATIPPGGVAGAHIHVGFEVMLYIIAGRVRHEYGDGLTEAVENGAGDFIFIEPGVPHEVFNLSDTDPVVAVVARSSAAEWDRIVPYECREGSATR